MVLCDAIKLDHTPLACNKRPEALEQVEKRPLMLGFRQEVNFLQQNKKRLLVEEESPVARAISDTFLKACLFAGIRIADIKQTSHCSISYQLTPSKGEGAGDQLWVSRYILCRVAESFKVCCSFEPQLDDPLAPSCGCEVTIAPVEPCRPQWAVQAGDKLAAATLVHMRVYGPGNEERFERCETLPRYILSTIVKRGGGSRGATVWVSGPTDVPHVVDRRPAGNCDPYAVIGRIAATLSGPLDGVIEPMHAEA
jgi:glutamine synthetase